MNSEKLRAHCPRCRHQQTFLRAEIHHWLHLALSILTGGLWLVSWAALCIGKVLRPWRCEHCGWHTPELRGERPEHAAMAERGGRAVVNPLSGQEKSPSAH